MNPLNWIRWKVVFVLVVVVGGFYLFGLDPLSRWRVNELGASGEHGARWQVGGLDLGILTGDLGLEQLLVDTPREKGRTTEKNRTFSTEKLSFDLNMDQTLRRRLHGSIQVQAPRLVVRRQKDGTINVGDIGGEESPPAPETPPKDWAKAIREWAEKLRKWEEARRKRQGEDEKPPQPGDKPEAPRQPDFKVDYARRVSYPFENVVRFVAEEIVGSGLEIQLIDEAGAPAGGDAAPIATLTDGEVRVENLSEKPSLYEEPITWTVSGKLAGVEVEIGGHLDLRKDATGAPKNEFRLQARTKAGQGLPLALANLLAGDSLPMAFERGTVELDAEVDLLDLERLNIQPRFGFRDVVIKPREGVKTIAGVEAARFCTLFNDASKQLQVLEIKDLRLTGTLRQPKVEIGDTLRQLVTSGVKAVVDKQVQAGIEKGTEKLKGLIDEQLKDSPAGEDLKKAGKSLGEGLKGILGGSKSSGSAEPKPNEPKKD
jgi:hypothetical protein